MIKFTDVWILLRFLLKHFRRLADTIADLSSDFLTTLDSKPIFPKTSGVKSRTLSTELPEQVQARRH